MSLPLPRSMLKANVSDCRATALNEVVSGESTPKSFLSVAQMIVGDARWPHVDGQTLLVKHRPLRDLSIGNHRLCSESNSEFGNYLDQRCVGGSTASLVGRRHVLTAAHAIVLSRLLSTYFVFGRTQEFDEAHADSDVLRLPLQRVYRASRLRAYVLHPSGADWALLELDREVEDLEPLTLGTWTYNAAATVVGYPLGLPLKQVEVAVRSAQAEPAIYFDAGSGASGSPLLQAGQLVGVLRGKVGLPDDLLRTHGDHTCIDPAAADCSQAQKITHASQIASALADFFDQ